MRSAWGVGFVSILCLAVVVMAQNDPGRRPRARDLGLEVGIFPPGPLNAITDVAGVQEIVDNLEVERLAWERDDRSKNEAAQDITPGTIPDQEPYGGTEDVILTQEEGVTYEPPVNPPVPPNRKED